MSKCVTGKCADTQKCKSAKCKREAVRAKRDALRKKVRRATCVVMACLAFGFLAGCNTATPASKSANSKACDNITTVNNYIGILPDGLTNGVALGSGGITISVSDLNGTIAQSADTAGGDATDLTANPSMAAGITGDAPMKMISDAVAAYASPKDAASATLTALLKRFGVGAATNAVADAVSTACPDGSCTLK